MGTSYEATCQDCKHLFEASEGGGFQFYELHCRQCGLVKAVSHDVVAPAKEQFQQSIDEAVEATGHSLEVLLKNPSVMQADTRNRLRKSIAEAASHFDDAIVPIVSRCLCGGQFGLFAPIRCPSCKSTNIKRHRLLEDYI